MQNWQDPGASSSGSRDPAAEFAYHRQATEFIACYLPVLHSPVIGIGGLFNKQSDQMI
jgi:hypothetical protein